eukprot:Hpha_TRINITY_DN15114_c4_g1::TRINITY_DN15114_c4_g1_i2::g.127085::m.127085
MGRRVVGVEERRMVRGGGFRGRRRRGGGGYFDTSFPHLLSAQYLYYFLHLGGGVGTSLVLDSFPPPIPPNTRCSLSSLPPNFAPLPQPNPPLKNPPQKQPIERQKQTKISPTTRGTHPTISPSLSISATPPPSSPSLAPPLPPT